MTITDIRQFLHTRAPEDTAEDWDNVGLLVGSETTPVTGVVVALDATPGALATAQALGANLLVTHHPLLLTPVRRLAGESLPYRLAAAGVSLLAAHTNLDRAAGGVNDTLAARLGLTDVTAGPGGLSRIGRLPAPMEPAAFARLLAKELDTAVQVSGTRPVSTVAVCGGSGGDFLEGLTPLVDTVVTGEVKHHHWLAANAAGLTLLVAGHYATEVPVVDTLCGWLQEAYPALSVTPYYEGAPYTTIQ